MAKRDLSMGKHIRTVYVLSSHTTFYTHLTVEDCAGSMISSMSVNVISLIHGNVSGPGIGNANAHIIPLEASTSALVSTLNLVGDIVNLTCSAVTGSGSDEEIARATMTAVGRDASTLAGTWGSYCAAIK
jgi:hypothetical protein